MKCFQTHLSEWNCAPEGFKSGKMDSFAVREPRKFFPFYLGIEANSQRAQESAEYNDISTNSEAIIPNAAHETAGIDPIEGALTSTQRPLHQAAIHELLSSSIETIEDTASLDVLNSRRYRWY